MHESLTDAVQDAADAAVGVILGSGLHRPVNQDGAPHDRIAVDESPVAAVEAAVAIVSQNKIVIRRHDQLAVLNVVQNLIGPFAAGRNLDEGGIHRRGNIAGKVFVGGGVGEIK